MKELLRELYFGFIAIVTISELFASKLFGLFFDLERPAMIMAVSVEAIRSHYYLAAPLDAFIGISALLVLWAGRHADTGRLGHYSVAATATGMLTYGSYQLYWASFEIGAFIILNQAVGVIYILFGVATWFIGKDLRLDVTAPVTAPQGNYSGTSLTINEPDAFSSNR